MLNIVPSGQVLGARIEGMDLSQPLAADDCEGILKALGDYGVVCFPNQELDPVSQKRFSAYFGSLEINVANMYSDDAHPEIMNLSNIVENGKPIGLADAGQDWHTDMSYSRNVAYANVLYALVVPRRDGVPLGCTEFVNLYRAYDDLPGDIKDRIRGRTATHDFNKFWEKMRRERGSTRPPLTEEQRRAKPPVSHPMVIRHPVSGRSVLYADPGYTMFVDGMDKTESDDLLAFLFDHQLHPKYRYKHLWTEKDVLMWDDLCTLHNAVADYRPDEHRLIKRCQVMADKVLQGGPLRAAA
jgi:taurine dioxygenase